MSQQPVAPAVSGRWHRPPSFRRVPGGWAEVPLGPLPPDAREAMVDILADALIASYLRDHGGGDEGHP